MLKTYKFKLLATNRQDKLHQIVNISSDIYNHCVALHKRYYKLFGKSLNMYKLQKHITKLKKLGKYRHWNLVPSQAIQNITERINESYKKFFDYVKKRKGLKCSPPKFKKRSRYKSFTLKQAGYKIQDNTIWLNGYEFKFYKSREIDGAIKTITVKRDSLGHFYICVSLEVNNSSNKPMTGKSAGFDFGLKTFLTSDENSNMQIEMPRYYLENITKLKRLSRNLSKKKRGSNNRKRAKEQLARLHLKIERQRKDFHFKLANNLLSEFDTLCFETLNIKAMQMLWGKKVSDYGYSQFFNILQSKAQEYGKTISQIDKFYPSSKACSCCGYVLEKLELKTREWQCPECKTNHSRDVNAANNILRVGTSTLAGETIRPTKVG